MRSPVSSLLLLVKKPGGGVRVCADYHEVNEQSLRDSYPLPLIKDTLAWLRNARFLTKLDMVAAFNKIWMKKGHEYLTAFM